MRLPASDPALTGTLSAARDPTSRPDEARVASPLTAASPGSCAGQDLVWVYTGDLASALDRVTWLETTAELRALGWRVTLVAVGQGGQEHIDGVEIHTLRRPRLYLVGQAIFHLRLLGLLARHWRSLDLVLFHSMSAPWLLPLRWLRPLAAGRGPLLVMDTRTLPMTVPELESVRLRVLRHFHNGMERVGNALADGRLAITPGMAEAVAIPPGKLWGLWPSGVRPETMSVAREIRVWPARDETIEVIYIGSMSYERNLGAFCQAVERAVARGLTIRLTLIGDGTERDDLARLAAQSKGCIQVLDPVPYREIPACLGRAHVGVLPFPDAEMFRVSSFIKLFEYLAAGMPVLATRIAAHTQVLGDCRCAFWAEHWDAEGLLAGLCQLWEQRDTLAERGEAAAIRVGDWTWGAAARKLSDALLGGLRQVRGRS